MRKLVSCLAAAFLAVSLGACQGTPAPADARSAPPVPAAAPNITGGPAIPVNEDTVLIDVRTLEEYKAGHLKGAISLNFNGGEFKAELPKLDPTKEYMLYCRSGQRSANAAQLMREAGITNVIDLGSLHNASQTTGLPIE
ncbi:MAG: rhodanese-like domain-containing protein [Actinomycetaceae bacterium]|nr:rhodanese-like domain-containing protein [Actinomycetaceae bacterium]